MAFVAFVISASYCGLLSLRRCGSRKVAGEFLSLSPLIAGTGRFFYSLFVGLAFFIRYPCGSDDGDGNDADGGGNDDDGGGGDDDDGGGRDGGGDDGSGGGGGGGDDDGGGGGW